MPQSSSQPGTPSVGSIDGGAIGHKKQGVVEALDVKMRPKDYAKLLRKIDWHLFPLLWSLYLLSFLDRASIGNAKVAGMSKDLHLVGLRYNTAAAVFFIPYCFGQIPSNIILKLFRPSRWIPMTMVAWGLITTLTCLVKTFQRLVIVRVFLGLAEAGLFPGVIYYISLWYPRAERAKRIAIWFSAASMAGAFGGLLAYGIVMMEGFGGLRGWQWIFCLEDIVTVLLALVASFYMYDYPDTAPFLTEAERYYHIELLKNDSNDLATHFEPQFILQALKDYKTHLQFVIDMGILIPAFGLALFMPTIVHELGFSAAKAQLLSNNIGHGTMIGFLSLTILLSLVAMWDYNRLNKQKERMCRERGITVGDKHEFRDMGDDSPLFRYTL